MRFSSSAVAFAVVGSTSALPANTYFSTPSACTTPVPSSTGCSSSSPIPQPCTPSCPPLPDCKTSCSTPPSAKPCDPPRGSSVVKPKVTSLYDVWTGAVHHGTSNGMIFKDGKSTDITTLLTFDLPLTFLPSPQARLVASISNFLPTRQRRSLAQDSLMFLLPLLPLQVTNPLGHQET